jgi:lysine-specific demethylase 8
MQPTQYLTHEDGGQDGADLGSSLKRVGLDVRDLPSVEAATPEALRTAVARRAPLRFRGLVDHWRALTEWTPSQLTAEHGDKVVTGLMGLPATGVLFPKDQRHYEHTLTFAEFI